MSRNKRIMLLALLVFVFVSAASGCEILKYFPNTCENAGEYLVEHGKLLGDGSVAVPVWEKTSQNSNLTLMREYEGWYYYQLNDNCGFIFELFGAPVPLD